MDYESLQGRRPRELRRRVLLPARVRGPAGWSDACVLNVSSRGLMIHARATAEAGTVIELHHGHYAIVARVMWRNGAHAGLLSEERIPIEEIMILGEAKAAKPPDVERRRMPRADESRARGRTIEFAGALAIAVILASGMVTMVQSALARPLAAVGAVLGG